MAAEFETFFLASSGASAALIGLLFVAVSIAPEKVFGSDAEAVRQAQALSAFTALVNALELAVGIQLWGAPGNRGSLDGLLELILGAYAIGLGRAWELLGALRSGFVSTVAGLIRPRTGPKPKLSRCTASAGCA